MTWRADQVLDLYHDGLEPQASAERGDQAELEAEHDRLSRHSDHLDFAGWYAPGWNRAARTGNVRVLGCPSMAGYLSSPEVAGPILATPCGGSRPIHQGRDGVAVPLFPPGVAATTFLSTKEQS